MCVREQRGTDASGNSKQAWYLLELSTAQLKLSLSCVDGLAYLSVKVVGCIAQDCHGKRKSNPAEDRMRQQGNARGAAEQVVVGPRLVIANARAEPFAVVRGGSFAAPKPCSAMLGTHPGLTAKAGTATPTSIETRAACIHSR